MQVLKEKLYSIEEYWKLCSDDPYVELIDGILYNMSPPSRIHQKILGYIFTRISNYIEKTNSICEVYPAPFAVQLSQDEDTIVEPDISVICDPKKLTDRGCVGAPDFIVEVVSPSNSSHDYVRKLNKYMVAGVQEYWIVDPRDSNIYVYHFSDNETKLFSYTFQDTVKSKLYNDLAIDFSKLLL